MVKLKFDDIDEWTPSSISIVDEPAHPLCKFEVYEDDEEYVKKSIEINDGEMMVEQNTQNEEPMVQAPVSFFEKLLGRTVAKAEEVPEVSEKPKEEPKEDIVAALEKRIESLEKKVAKLEGQAKEEKPEEEAKEEPVKGAVAKSEGETGDEVVGEEILDTEEVVTKSIDPDTITITSSEETLLERTGRKTNGMTW